MNSVRVFIAVEIPEDVQTTLDRVIKHLKAESGAKSLRWVSARAIHITLKFLGEVPVSNLEGLTRAMTTQAGSFAPFDIHLGGLGAFPSPRKPRVIWIGIAAPPTLGALQQGIDRACGQLGFPPEARPFTPHLTLARVNQDASLEELWQVESVLSNPVNPLTVGDPAVFQACAVHLIRSDLRPTGAVYTHVASAPLAGSK